MGGSPSTRDRIPVPGDLPEHSLVSYNPNRTRYSSPGPRIGNTEADPGDSEKTLLPDNVPTEYLTGPEAAEPAGAVRHEDRLRLVRLIGRGGCGEVWEAVQVQLDRPVAVKTLRRDRLRGSAREQTRADLVRNFREEALIAARLDHPNIVPVYDYGRDADGTPQLTMKLVRGEPWDKMLKADREALGFDDFLAKHLGILTAVANAVAFAHSRHIVHRDIKPSQVMVGEYGEVLLMDWGLAVVVGDDGTTASMAAQRPDWFSLPTLATASSPAGTPAFMAPEQTRSTAIHVGTWTDIYLLGGCLYCVLTGTGPHEGATSHEAFLRAARGEIRDPRSFHPEGTVPDELAALALQALAADPEKRVPSADEFVHRIEDWISGASRRRESQRLTVQLLSEVHRPRANYSMQVAFIDRIQQAAGLWPGNPDVPELRAHALEDYAELALERGDLLLALSQAELLPESPRRTDLLHRIEGARVQRKRARRMLRISVAAVVVLVALVIIGGTVSLRRISREREEAIAQKNIATAARDTAEMARKEAEAARAVADSEQLYAQIRYATSLVEAGRHELARAVLWNIPESARDWEWAYLIDRAHQSLAEFPFAVTETSTEGNYFYTAYADGTVEVRDTMAGALLARLDCETTAVTILPAPQDTHIDIVAGARLLRLAPPAWQAEVLADLPAVPAIARRTVGKGNFALMYGDGSAAIHEAGTGRLRFATPPMPLKPIAIDGDDGADRLLLAYTTFFRIHRLGDGSVEKSIAGWTTATSAALTDRGYSFAVVAGDNVHLCRIEDGLLNDYFVPGTQTQIQTHPRGDTLVIGPGLASASLNAWRGKLPVGDAKGTRAKYASGNVIAYWGGTNGEAGVIGTDLNPIADLRGYPGEIRDMWVTMRTPQGRPERVFSTTSDGTTQVWPATPIKSIADLPGQWSSFRSEGRYAVSIGDFYGTITDIATGTSARRVGTMFALYRGINISEKRDRIFTFGYGQPTGRVFGWEVMAYGSGERLRIVKAGTEPDTLPYLWTVSPDDARVALFWRPGEEGQILDAEDGRLVATIPPTTSAATAMSFTREGTLIVGDNAGLLREIDIADGSERRRVQTGAPVWALRRDVATGRLYVSGGDRRVRAYTWTGDAPEKAQEMRTGGDPAVLLHLSGDGGRLLGLTNENEVVVWSQPDGAELLRFRIDAEIQRIELNDEGTRIFGLGNGTLGVWDLKGREVARVPNVIDVSLKSRRLLLHTSKARTSRDVAVELPPYRAEELPGDASMPFQDRFHLWRREQHRNWWMRKAVQPAPASLASARASIRGTVAENGRQLSHDIDAMLEDIAGEVRTATPALAELLQKLGLLYVAQGDHDWYHFADGLWQGFGPLDAEPAQSLMLAAAPYTEYRTLRQAEARSRGVEDRSPWVTLELASELETLGHGDLARRYLRNCAAKLGSQGREGFSRTDLLRLLRIAGTDIPELPDEIRVPAGSSMVSERGGTIRRRIGLAPEGMDAEAFEAARAAIGQERDRAIAEWLESAAPAPDFGPALAAAKARFPPPPPGDMLLSDLMGDVLDRLEREQLGGKTSAEAFEEAGRRFDDSVAKFQAELDALAGQAARRRAAAGS